MQPVVISREGQELLRVVGRLRVEYLRALTGLRLGAGIVQPLKEYDQFVVTVS